MNKIQESLISIVIPSYNSEKTIKRTIDSVLKQTYKNFELIIIDDNSSDNTVLIIKEISDKRITLYINKQNLGFQGNWNKVLKKANGIYIKLLPDDDLLHKNALLEQIKILEKFENVVLVGSKRNIIDEKDALIMKRGKSLSKHNPCNYKEVLKATMRYGTNPIGEPGSTLFRASALKNNIEFDAELIHFIDLDFYLKILQYGDYYFIDKVLSSFRVWNRSYSVSNKKDNYQESNQFFQNLYTQNSFLNITDLIISKLNIIKNRILKFIFYFFISKIKS